MTSEDKKKLYKELWGHLLDSTSTEEDDGPVKAQVVDKRQKGKKNAAVAASASSG